MVAFPDPKGPGDTLDHRVNWAPMLEGDTITASTWTVPAGLTKTSDSSTTTTTTVWIAGGQAGQTYGPINTVTTAGGRVIARTIELSVEAA